MRNVCLLMLLLWAPCAWAQPMIAVVGALSGTATTAPAEGAAAMPLLVRQLLPEGAVVRTGPGSRLRLDLVDGTALTLGDQTSVRLDHLARADDGLPTRVTHVIGILRALVAPQRGPAGLEIGTDTVVAAVRGTEWIQRAGPGTTDVFVKAGRVSLRAPAGAHALPPAVTLTAGEGVTFDGVPARPGTRSLPPIGPAITHTPVARWPAAKIAEFDSATRLP